MEFWLTEASLLDVAFLVTWHCFCVSVQHGEFVTASDNQ